MTIDAILTPDGLYLDGRLFSAPLPLSDYVDLLGQPTRIHSGPPAPYGHRNNQIYIYDETGIWINEHHATGRIQEVTFALDEARCTFPMRRPFQGRLEVNGILFRPYMDVREIFASGSAGFVSILPGKYKAKDGVVYICLTAKRIKDPSRRRAPKHRAFVEVSVGFSDDGSSQTSLEG